MSAPFAPHAVGPPVGPVAVGAYTRAWLVTRYDDVRTVLTDPRFSVDVTRWPGSAKVRPSAAVGLAAHMLHADPPDHARLRRLVQPELASRRAALRPLVERRATDLLDHMADAGDAGDLLSAYARPLPAAVLAHLLGFAATDVPWLLEVVFAQDRPADRSAAQHELAAALRRRLAAARVTPGDDLLSAVVARSDAAGARDGLDDGELISTMFLLVMAGFDTTANLLAGGAIALLTHPDQLVRVRADPALLPRAVEELLRYVSPVNHADDRFTLVDVELGGVRIPAGEWVLPVISAADRDETRFPDAGTLDVGRDPAGHLAFGHGVHHCLGAPLARLEAEVGLRCLLQRFPGLELAVPPEQIDWRPVGLMTGPTAVPVRWRRDDDGAASAPGSGDGAVGAGG